MSEVPALREVQPGVTGAVVALGQGLMAALPPAFIGLLLVNTLFLAVLFHFLDKQGEQRAAAVNRLLDHCLSKEVRGGHHSDGGKSVPGAVPGGDNGVVVAGSGGGR